MDAVESTVAPIVFRMGNLTIAQQHTTLANNGDPLSISKLIDPVGVNVANTFLLQPLDNGCNGVHIPHRLG